MCGFVYCICSSWFCACSSIVLSSPHHVLSVFSSCFGEFLATPPFSPTCISCFVNLLGFSDDVQVTVAMHLECFVFSTFPMGYFINSPIIARWCPPMMPVLFSQTCSHMLVSCPSPHDDFSNVFEHVCLIFAVKHVPWLFDKFQFSSWIVPHHN